MDSNPFTIASYTRIGRVLRPQGAYRDSCAANPPLDSSTQATAGFESFNWKSGLRYLTVTHGTVFNTPSDRMTGRSYAVEDGIVSVSAPLGEKAVEPRSSGMALKRAGFAVLASA
jgi:hypothetical protein